MQLQIDQVKTMDLASAWKAIDRLEEDIAAQPDVVFDFPVLNRFTDGLYSRQFLMPKGSLLTSEIHLTQHQYTVMEGVVAVWTPETQCWTRLDAPYHGITEPGTRRVLYAFEHTVWTTFHPLTPEENEHRNVEKILERLLDKPHRQLHHQLKKEQLPQCQ